mgnify:CR=1 FL=1
MAGHKLSVCTISIAAIAAEGTNAVYQKITEKHKFTNTEPYPMRLGSIETNADQRPIWAAPAVSGGLGTVGRTARKQGIFWPGGPISLFRDEMMAELSV